MKLRIFLAAALCGLAALADDETVGVSIGCNLRLVDGSTIKGELATETIAGETIFAPKLELAARVVKTIAFDAKKGTASVELTNGDKLTMTPSTEAFRVRSILGEFDVPRQNVKSLSLNVQKAGVDCTQGLIFYCSFDGESAVLAPACGPSGALKSGGSFVDGVSGQALHVVPGSTAATFDLSCGFLPKNGTIEFWGKIDDGMARMSNNGCPRFFCIKSKTSGHEISQDWNNNNGEGGSGLTFRMNGFPALSTSKTFGYGSYAPIEQELYKWHHYAFAWDAETGIQLPDGRKASVAVYVDGQFVMSTPYNPSWKSAPINEMETTLLFPTRESESGWYGRVPHSIDEFKIWNYAKTNFD